ncbi:MAG TPA: outer membrane beta-barrel protein [Longimicrobiaceae bacterium]
MQRLSSVVLAAAAAAVTAGPALAQRASPGTETWRFDPRGVSVGVNLNGGTLATQELGPGVHPGLGLGVTLGYGVSDAVTLFARGDVAYARSNLDVGARYRFGSPAAALRPYVEAGFTRTGTLIASQRTSGYGVTAGAGVEYYVRHNFAVDVGVVHSRGRFTTGPLDGDAFNTTRLNLGFRWHP